MTMPGFVTIDFGSRELQKVLNFLLMQDRFFFEKTPR